MLNARWIWAAPLAWALCGCSSDRGGDQPSGVAGSPSGGSAGMSGAGGASATGGTSGGGGDAPDPRCEHPYTPADAKPSAVRVVRGRVVDPDGKPLANQSVQLCGTNVCFYGKSNDAGEFATCPQEYLCSRGIVATSPMLKPAVKVGNGMEYAKFAVSLPDEPEPNVGDVATVKLPDLGQGQAMKAGARATSGGVTLVIPESAVFEIDPLFFTEDETQFRAAQFPAGKTSRAIDPALGLELIFALSPVDTAICPPAQVEVENRLEWTPGTKVEFFLHGVSIKEDWAPYGGWAKVSDGVVSEDGRTISTAAGKGIGELSAIGLRRAKVE